MTPPRLEEDEEVKAKKKVKKVDKFTKKWFVENYSKIQLEDILVELGAVSRDPKFIYGMYLMRAKNKPEFSADLYERVNSYYHEFSHPRRVVEPDF